MQPDILMLGERLVLALERMSEDVNNISVQMKNMGQDVKTMSTHIFNISNNVSHLFHEKRGDSVSSGKPAAEREASAQSEYSAPYEQADGRSLSDIEEVENDGSSFEVGASLRFDHSENSYVLSLCNEEIKTEVQSKVEEIGESCDGFHTGNGEDNVRRSYREENSVCGEGDYSVGKRCSVQSGLKSYSQAVHLNSEEYMGEGRQFPQRSSAKDKRKENNEDKLRENTKEQVDTVCESELSDVHSNQRKAKDEPGPGTEMKQSPLTQRSASQQNGVHRRAKGPFFCKTCGKSFLRILHLKHHVMIHTRERPFQCTLCDKGFIREHGLIIHMRQHSGERPFICSVCNKSFTHSGTLYSHMQVHSGEKPFQCSLCQRAFARKGNLEDHIRVHLGVKPFQCAVCKKVFSRKTNLEQHMRVHSGEKPFKCSVCDKSFTTNRYLLMHVRIHTGENPYKCAGRHSGRGATSANTWKAIWENGILRADCGNHFTSLSLLLTQTSTTS